jgi:hypothetical protein
MVSFFSYADDQYVFESTIASYSQSAFDQQITINRNFININAVVSKLNTLGLKARIKNYNNNELQNVPIKSNDTVNDFINIAAAKFNYSVTEDGVNVIFQAINPSKPIPSTINTTLQDKHSRIVQPTWVLDPNKSKTLRMALSLWCKKANWQLIWNVKADYPITTAWTVSGSFESAINEVLKASQATEAPLQAVMHDSNRVLEIYTIATGK